MPYRLKDRRLDRATNSSCAQDPDACAVVGTPRAGGKISEASRGTLFDNAEGGRPPTTARPQPGVAYQNPGLEDGGAAPLCAAPRDEGRVQAC